MNERRVALVGFGNEIMAGAQPPVRVGALQAPADQEGRILAGLGQDAGDQARRRRLAVRAGNRDRVPEAHQLGEHLRTSHHRQPQLAGRGDLGVGGIDRAGHDDEIRIADVIAAVSDEDLRAEATQALCDAGVLQVGTLHRVAEIQQHLGDAAHADAADADEVDAIDLPHPILHAASPSSRHSSATRRVASGRASSRASVARDITNSRSSMHRAISVARRSGVSSACGISTAAPASTR